MKNNETHRELRKDLLSFIRGGMQRCKWGVYVFSDKNRHNIFETFDYFLSSIVALYPNKNLQIFVDQGIINNRQAEVFNDKYGDISLIIADSAVVNGIQLAVGARLREELSEEPQKMIKFGKDAGYPEGTMISLGFEL